MGRAAGCLCQPCEGFGLGAGGFLPHHWSPLGQGLTASLCPGRGGGAGLCPPQAFPEAPSLPVSAAARCRSAGFSPGHHFLLYTFYSLFFGRKKQKAHILLKVRKIACKILPSKMYLENPINP